MCLLQCLAGFRDKPRGKPPAYDTERYPAYCVTASVTPDDRVNIVACWIWCSRTNDDVKDGTSYVRMREEFYTSVERRTGADTRALRDVEIFRRIVQTLINGRADTPKTAERFRAYNVSHAVYSAMGLALIDAVKSGYAPREWTETVHSLWIRCYSELMRNVMRKTSLCPC